MRNQVNILWTAILTGFLVLPQTGSAASRYEVKDTKSYIDNDLGLTVVGGVVDLPAGRSWQGDLWSRGGVLEQIAIIPLGKELEPSRGRRLEQSHRDKMTERGKYNLQHFWSSIYEYATEHDGIGPASLEDLDPENTRRLQDRLNKSPWQEDKTANVSGPFYFLIPEIPVSVPRPGHPEGNVKITPGPIFLELRPYINDGRHWVLFSNGRTERREIDQELLRKFDLRIRPVITNIYEEKEAPSVLPYNIYALKKRDGPGTAKLTIRDSSTGEVVKIAWDLGKTENGSPEVLASWSQARALAWVPYLAYADAPVLRRWLSRSKLIYSEGEESQRPRPNQAGHTTNMFGVLGGRAAIRETIQLEALRAGEQRGKGERTIPISDIEGVQAEPLPFEEMLGSRRGGRLSLAENAPLDRFFIYFGQPSALQAFLSQGTDFIFRSGSLYNKRSIAYDLKGRYYRRLGVSEGWIRKFLESGAVEELALVVPDLFFIDGTEVTAIARVPRIKRLAPLLKILGVLDLKEGEVTVHRSDTGTESYWTRRDDLVLVGTYRPELDRVIKVINSGGEGSLGRSAEFKYMLEKLPLNKKTRAYAYLSDPFIRRLTGPEVKIAQLRRMNARGTLESITAGALLRKLDGGDGADQLDRLAEMNYVPPLVSREGYSLDSDLMARSATYGTAADLASLIRHPVDMVTQLEATAYKSYVANYNRYWRQYFDPIAVRLDDAPGGALEMSTFILPLVNSSIYNSLKERLAAAEGKPLDVPLHSPEPVVKLSLNLAESQWIKIADSFSRTFTRYTSIDPELFDILGPGLHLSILDGDPIIALGSGDVMDAFGGLMTSGRGVGFSIPILISVLTRPSKIFVELTDMEAGLGILRKAARQGKPGRTGARGSRSGMVFRQVDGKDEWIFSYSLEGIISFRMGIEIRDGYLVISNLPWSHEAAITGQDRMPLGGAAMSVNVSAIREQLPSLFTSAGENYQRSSLQGMGYLYPLLLTRTPTVEGAVALNNRLFGFRPLHVGEGQWRWSDGVLESTSFGSASWWKLPRYRDGDRSFGLFQGVEEIKVNMQLEDEGLRATCRWVWKVGAGK